MGVGCVDAFGATGTRMSKQRSSGQQCRGEEAAAASSSDDGMKEGGLNNWGRRVIQTG